MRHVKRALSQHQPLACDKRVAYGLTPSSTAYVGTGIFHESARTSTQGFT